MTVLIMHCAYLNSTSLFTNDDQEGNFNMQEQLKIGVSVSLTSGIRFFLE